MSSLRPGVNGWSIADTHVLADSVSITAVAFPAPCPEFDPFEKTEASDDDATAIALPHIRSFAAPVLTRRKASV